MRVVKTPPEKLSVKKVANSPCSSLPEVSIFWNDNFGEPVERLTANPGYGYDLLDTDWDEQISSIKVHSGVWRFFKDPGWDSPLGDLGPGEYAWTADLGWEQDNISSFACVDCS